MQLLKLLINDAQTLLGLVDIIQSIPAALAEIKGRLMNAQEQLDLLKGQVAILKTDTAAAIDRVAVDVAELNRKITEGTVNPADIAAISADLAGISASLKGVDPLPDFPAPEPPPAA